MASVVNDRIVALIRGVNAGVTEANCDELIKLLNQIEEHVPLYGRLHVPNFRSHATQLREFYATVKARRERPASIPEPIGMYFASEPGAGKSTVLCSKLPALLQGLLDWKGDPEKFCKNMCFDSEGRVNDYDNQPMVIIDEFACSPESNEVSNLLKYMSSFATEMESPFMDTKRKTFRARLAVVLSNMKSEVVWLSDLREPEAFRRRFGKFCYLISANATIKRGTTMDYKKFTEETRVLSESSESPEEFEERMLTTWTGISLSRSWI